MAKNDRPAKLDQEEDNEEEGEEGEDDDRLSSPSSCVFNKGESLF
jgi:hypothetical protein